MPVIQRVVKPTTHRGKKAILKKEPKLIEDAKHTLFIKGRQTSEVVTNCMKDLFHLKKPNAQTMQRRNNILPFENIVPVEQLSRKLNASLFIFGSHSKKRPDNLIIGRMYDNMLLDIAEFGVENYVSLTKFSGPKIGVGMKPLLVFNGEIFETNYEYGRIKSLLTDMFQREHVQKIRLQGLEHVISFTAVDNKILLRSYRILLKKSDSRVPRIEVEEIGPRLDLICRRSKLASQDLFKQACKQPKELKVKTKKNISKDTLGTTFARIHVGAQKINNIQTRKMKGLKKTLAEKRNEKKRKSLEDPGSSSKKLKSDLLNSTV